jgi:hypothetical protein
MALLTEAVGGPGAVLRAGDEALFQLLEVSTRAIT